MSLRYALLGLLTDHPASGYELTKHFENSLQRWAWHARHSQIYPELGKLATDGLIETYDEGARGRRTYAITDAGLAELREWLLDPPAKPLVRNEGMLRMFLLSALEPADRREVLVRYEKEAIAAGEEVERAIKLGEEDVQPGQDLWFGQLAAEYGRRSFAAQRDWARWAIDTLDVDSDVNS